MRFIGVLGVLVLLGLAWAMSYHRREVRLRVVLWGLGLQFLFAVIILREDYWSFVGMGVLAGLVAVYLLRQDRVRPDRGPGAVAVILAGSGAIGVALGFLGSQVVGIAAIVLLVLLLVNGRWKPFPSIQAPLGALFVVLCVTWLVIGDFYGQVIFSMFSEKVSYFLSLSDYGARFLFGNLADSQYFFPGSVDDVAGVWFPVCFQGAADNRFLRRVHGSSLLPRSHAGRDRGAGPFHAMDGGHEWRRNPVVYRQHICRPDRGPAVDQAVSQRYDSIRAADHHGRGLCHHRRRCSCRLSSRWAFRPAT